MPARPSPAAMPTTRRLIARKSDQQIPDTHPLTWFTVLNARTELYISLLDRVLSSGTAAFVHVGGTRVRPVVHVVAADRHDFVVTTRRDSGITSEKLLSSEPRTRVTTPTEPATRAVATFAARNDGAVLLVPTDVEPRVDVFDVAAKVRNQTRFPVSVLRVPTLAAMTPSPATPRTWSSVTRGDAGNAQVLHADALDHQAELTRQGTGMDVAFHVHTTHRSHIDIFTDGSARDGVAAGVARINPADRDEKLRLGREVMAVTAGDPDHPADSFSAEAATIIAAIRIGSVLADTVTIYTDARAVIAASTETVPRSNPRAEKYRIALRAALFDAAARGVDVVLKWVKGHDNVRNNEISDEMASFVRRHVTRNRDAGWILDQLVTPTTV